MTIQIIQHVAFRQRIAQRRQWTLKTFRDRDFRSIQRYILPLPRKAELFIGSVFSFQIIAESKRHCLSCVRHLFGHTEIMPFPVKPVGRLIGNDPFACR